MAQYFIMWQGSDGAEWHLNGAEWHLSRRADGYFITEGHFNRPATLPPYPL